MHKIGNVLDKLPKRTQPAANAHLHEIMNAENRKSAVQEIERFERVYADKYPKAWNCLEKDQKELLELFSYPALHRKHIRTTNVIESSFSTVKARTKQTKGAGSRAAGLAMAFKLMEKAEQSWRKLDGASQMKDVHEEVIFVDGYPQQSPAEEPTNNN